MIDNQKEKDCRELMQVLLTKYVWCKYIVNNFNLKMFGNQEERDCQYSGNNVS